MILTCSECHTQYRLDPDNLGSAGRTVRCVDCKHTWFQASKEESPPPPPSVVEKEEKEEDVLKQDDAVFEAILSGDASAEPSVSTAPSHPAPVAVEREKKREVALPSPALPVVTYNPFGVGASAFGVLTFFLCFFLTLTIIFLAQRPILHHLPQMSLLYKTIGFDLNAPGEGLRISELVVERHNNKDKQDRSLVVKGKMTNMTKHEIDAPALHLILKNTRNGVIKEWNLKPSKVRIAAGDVVPVALQLMNAPEEGSLVEVRVKGK